MKNPFPATWTVQRTATGGFIAQGYQLRISGNAWTILTPAGTELPSKPTLVAAIKTVAAHLAA